MLCGYIFSWHENCKNMICGMKFKWLLLFQTQNKFLFTNQIHFILLLFSKFIDLQKSFFFKSLILTAQTKFSQRLIKLINSPKDIIATFHFQLESVLVCTIINFTTLGTLQKGTQTPQLKSH